MCIHCGARLIQVPFAVYRCAIVIPRRVYFEQIACGDSQGLLGLYEKAEQLAPILTGGW